MGTFAVKLGRVPDDEFARLVEIAAAAKFRGVRSYATADAGLPNCKRSFFVKIARGGKILRHVDHVPERTEHIVIATNPGCYNGWEEDGQDHQMHLEQGCRYLVDRNPVHWAVNDGATDRIHLLVEYE